MTRITTLDFHCCRKIEREKKIAYKSYKRSSLVKKECILEDRLWNSEEELMLVYWTGDGSIGDGQL